MVYHPPRPRLMSADAVCIYVCVCMCAQYELHLSASDNLKENHTIVVIHVKDVNDNPPVFERPTYRTQITEEDDRNLPKRVLQVRRARISPGPPATGPSPSTRCMQHVFYTIVSTAVAQALFLGTHARPPARLPAELAKNHARARGNAQRRGVSTLVVARIFSHFLPPTFFTSLTARVRSGSDRFRRLYGPAGQ